MFPFHFSKVCSNQCSEEQIRTQDGCGGSGDPAEEAARLDNVERIVAALESSSAKAHQVLVRMTPNTRRHLLVVAAAKEWYGSDQVRQQLVAADTDHDKKISSADFDKWVEGALISKAKINFKTLMLVSLHAALPFIAFGFLDNCTMILAGDAIDDLFGGPLGLSVMGAAALGGVVSGGLGIQIHGLAERGVQKLRFLPRPNVHPMLRLHRSYFRADHIGGTLGIFIGLMLGMTPLLFVETKARH